MSYRGVFCYGFRPSSWKHDFRKLWLQTQNQLRDILLKAEVLEDKQDGTHGQDYAISGKIDSISGDNLFVSDGHVYKIE